MATITLQELIDRVPDPLKPFAAQYGPALLTYGVQQLTEIVAMLIAGDVEAPYRAAVKAMTLDQLNAETERFTATDSQHAQENADKVASQKRAAMQACGILASMLLALVGL